MNSFLMGMVFLTGGSNDSLPSIYIDRLYAGLHAQSVQLGISADTLTTLEAAQVINGDTVFTHRQLKIANGNTDIFVNESLSPSQIAPVRTQLLRSSVLIGDFTRQSFSYDLIPSLLRDEVETGAKRITAYRQGQHWSCYILHDTVAAAFNLVVIPAQGAAISYPLPQQTTRPDLLLADITDDQEPEIFVFTKGSFMGRTLVEMAIFSIASVKRMEGSE